jgi:DNA ligase-1
LREHFDDIAKKGGEGIMLRAPGSLYTSGRSKSLKKYKQFLDTEVKVVENNYPHGFECQMINGKNLFVGLSDNYEAAKQVQVGSTITEKYLVTNAHGTLQFPKFYRERSDVKWEELINEQ